MASTPDPLFRSLADPTRRAIFERLCHEGELTVGALTRRAGISQPAVSKHLRVLAGADLVSGRAQGREVYYSVRQGALDPLVHWTEQMKTVWEARIDRLEELLNRMDQ